MVNYVLRMGIVHNSQGGAK